MAMQSKEFIKISVVYKNLLSWVRIKRDFVFTDHIIKFTITSKDWYHVHYTFSNPILILFLIQSCNRKQVHVAKKFSHISLFGITMIS